MQLQFLDRHEYKSYKSSPNESNANIEEKRDKIHKFYTEKLALLLSLDKTDSKPGDGLLDISVFDKHFSKTAKAYPVSEPQNHYCKQMPKSIDSVHIDIHKQARLMTMQQFGLTDW